VKVKVNNVAKTFKIIVGNVIILADMDFKALEVLSGNVNKSQAQQIVNNYRKKVS